MFDDVSEEDSSVLDMLDRRAATPSAPKAERSSDLTVTTETVSTTFRVTVSQGPLQVSLFQDARLPAEVLTQKAMTRLLELRIKHNL